MVSKFCYDLVVAVSSCLENFFFQWKSYIPWVLVIFGYFWLFLVFWLFKWCSTFENVCQWSLKLFGRKNNVFYVLPTVVTGDLGWFSWIWKPGKYKEYQKFAWKQRSNSVKTLFMNLNNNLTHKKVFWNGFTVFQAFWKGNSK